eukprot:TRINITY_DN9347_c0_g1_i7.p1 TRINITY_DN9347_c0_g1~~TRINITY_DN9347_c0_g1_i7.p1  ORF type:complete len:136 (+),score=45.95 TRINITY_DN9347_c0_g1_i7:182-589(+)
MIPLDNQETWLGHNLYGVTKPIIPSYYAEIAAAGPEQTRADIKAPILMTKELDSLATMLKGGKRDEDDELSLYFQGDKSMVTKDSEGQLVDMITFQTQKDTRIKQTVEDFLKVEGNQEEQKDAGDDLLDLMDKAT